MPDDSVQPVPAVSFSGRYLLIVGGLLVLIIAMLASLWARERSRRANAEKAVVELQDKLAGFNKSIGQLMGLGAMGRPLAEEPAIRPFQRQDHVPVPVTLDGAKRQAFVLPAGAAERFGFQAGDVIVVAPAATSRPAPSGAEREVPASSPAGG